MIPPPMPSTPAKWATVVPAGTTAIVTRGGSPRAGTPGDARASPATTSTTIAAMADTALTFAKVTFFKLDPAWRRRVPGARAEDEREFLAACVDFATDRLSRHDL